MSGETMRIGIAADHAGFSLKEELAERLRESAHEVRDFGPSSLNPEDDYPDYVVPLAQSVANGEVERGVAICGSGVGACVPTLSLLCATSVFSVPLWLFLVRNIWTTEAQRTQRLHREES